MNVKSEPIRIHLDEDEKNADWLRSKPSVRKSENAALAQAMKEIARDKARASATPADGAAGARHSAKKAWETRRRKKEEQAGAKPAAPKAEPAPQETSENKNTRHSAAKKAWETRRRAKAEQASVKPAALKAEPAPQETSENKNARLVTRTQRHP